MIRCLIFDLDGTLFDSREANVISYQLAFKDAGLTLDVEAYEKNFGHRFNELMDIMLPSSDDVARNKIKQQKAAYYSQQLSLVKPNLGLIELLKSAGDNYKTALVTTASRVNVTNLLEHFSIKENLFDHIITGEDVTYSKPNPECYKKAIAVLGAHPEECLVFEDSPIGIEAATNAGAHVIRVTI